MNRLYWHDHQVGYVCFIPFVWEQRGVIAAVADQTAMISHLLPMCWATRGRSWGHVMMWARFGSQGSIALNWHSRYSGTHYSGTWLYLITWWYTWYMPQNGHVVHFLLAREIAPLLWAGCYATPTQLNNCYDNLDAFCTWLKCIKLNKIVVAMESFEKCTFALRGGPSHVTTHRGQVRPNLLTYNMKAHSFGTITTIRFCVQSDL